MFRFRFVAVLLIFALLSSSTFGQRVFRNFHRRAVRQPAAVAVAHSPAEAKSELQRFANEIKADAKSITQNDLNRSKSLLQNALGTLQNRLPKEFSKEAADEWSNTLKLTELRATLTNDVPDQALLDAAQSALYSDKEGARWIIFDPVRNALRRYLSVARMLKEESYQRQWTNVCENLVKYIDTYSEGRNPGYFVALSDTVTWLDDISFIDSRAQRLAQLTREACSGVNVRLQVSSDFAAAGFQKEINQTLDINETINGTRVVGDGNLAGSSSAKLVPSQNRAGIKVLAETVMESTTKGNHPPVTLNTYTTGTLRGEKQILISSDSIRTQSARSRAQLTSELSNIRINACPIIKLLARLQIDSQQDSSEAEAERRAERRMNNQMNERIDENIARLNDKYQKIRSALNKTGLFPREWNLSSTSDQIDWSILLGNSSQPSAPLAAPSIDKTNGLSVQVHQSALNNMLAILLAGRFVDEEKSSERLAEFFGETPKFLERKSEETPAKVSFGARAPVDVLFIDNKIRVVVRLNDIQVMDNTGRSFTISVEYKITAEDRDGKKLIVFEQTESEAFPAGFKSGGGTPLSATQTMIRTYLMRRLESLPKRYEAEPLALKGEWEGTGELVPQFASSENGWLTLTWNWKSAK